MKAQIYSLKTPEDAAMCAAESVVASALGAGDAFDAGFVSALAEGLALPAALQRGNAVRYR